MCGLCGLLGEDIHWSDPLTDDLPLRQERLRRIAAINRILSPFYVRVSDFQGRYYLIQSPTGAQDLAQGLEQLWEKTQLMTNRRLDILAASTISHFEQNQ